MSVIFWPSTLPQKPRSQTLSASPRSMVAAFAPDEGVELTRPRITAPIHVLEFTWPTMTEAQAVIFREFFEVTTKGGALPFAWQDPRTDEWFMWKPVPTGPAYQESDAGPDAVTFSSTLVRQPIEPWWVSYVPPSGTTIPDVMLDFENHLYALNGVKSTMKGIMQMSRASIGSYFDSTGLMRYAAIDAMRMDHDPKTLAPLGLLLERWSQNLNLYSHGFSTGWATSGAALTANDVAGMDGTITAGRITEDSGNSAHYIRQAVDPSWVSGISYVVSGYFKRHTGTRHAAISLPSSIFGTNAAGGFNLSTGVATVVVSGTSTSVGMDDVGGGWWRCWIKSTATSTGTGVSLFRITSSATSISIYTGDGSSALSFWGAQIEVGNLTSYMPTTSASFLRYGDVVTIEASKLPVGFDTAGTIQCELTNWHTEGNLQFNRALMLTANGDLNNRISVAANDVSGNGDTYVASVQQAFLGVGAVSSGATANFAMAYAANNFAISKNGAAVVTDGAGTVPPVDTVAIGYQMRRAHFKRVSMWASRLSNADLLVLSA
jgi:hypothetical protein